MSTDGRIIDSIIIVEWARCFFILSNAGPSGIRCPQGLGNFNASQLSIIRSIAALNVALGRIAAVTFTSSGL